MVENEPCVSFHDHGKNRKMVKICGYFASKTTVKSERFHFMLSTKQLFQLKLSSFATIRNNKIFHNME